MAVPAPVISLYKEKRKRRIAELLAISDIERNYLTKQSRKIYIALEEMNFLWDEKDIEDFRKMWNSGFSLQDVAEAFDRDPDEVALLAMDQARKDQIKPRPGGIFGRRKQQ